ncbi:MAG: DsbA family protein [Candidatus Magasanikbacteria bacterium]
MKLPTTKLLLVFIPILLITGGFFYVQFLQYEPLYPEQNNQKQEVSKIPILPNDPILGNKSSPKTIVVFEDLACKACKIQQEILNKLLKKYPKEIKIVWKGLPIKDFPYSSTKAHEYAFCMHRQNKFKEFLNLALANSSNLRPSILEQLAEKIELDADKLDDCLNSNKPQNYIKQTKRMAKILKIQSVPAVFINGNEIKPPQTLSGWESKLNLHNEKTK